MRNATTRVERPRVPMTTLETRDDADPGAVLADWHTIRIRTRLGYEFRQTTRVVLRRPWWLPAFLFHELLRSIVIEDDGRLHPGDLARGWNRP